MTPQHLVFRPTHRPVPAPLDAGVIEEVFRTCFEHRYQTRLKGGAPEPFYRVGRDNSPHVIFYRHDYASSALHEIAHWCVAGTSRRKLDDYGYWYEPDGRTEEQQRLFEQVEVKPQALESLFAHAAGIDFQVSADNLASAAGPSAAFVDAITKQAAAYRKRRMPPRAQRFLLALHAASVAR